MFPSNARDVPSLVNRRFTIYNLSEKSLNLDRVPKIILFRCILPRRFSGSRIASLRPRCIAAFFHAMHIVLDTDFNKERHSIPSISYTQSRVHQRTKGLGSNWSHTPPPNRVVWSFRRTRIRESSIYEKSSPTRFASEVRAKSAGPLTLNTINPTRAASLAPNNEGDVMVAPAGVLAADPSSEITTPVTRGTMVCVTFPEIPK